MFMAKCQGRESRAELVVVNGKVLEIVYSSVKGKRPLSGTELRDFQDLTRHYAEEIVEKWIDYFILHKAVQAERITRRIR